MCRDENEQSSVSSENEQPMCMQAECAEALTNINVLKKKAHSEIAAETATIEQAMQIRSENAEVSKSATYVECEGNAIH